MHLLSRVADSIRKLELCFTVWIAWRPPPRRALLSHIHHLHDVTLRIELRDRRSCFPFLQLLACGRYVLSFFTSIVGGVSPIFFELVDVFTAVVVGMCFLQSDLIQGIFVDLAFVKHHLLGVIDGVGSIY